MKPRAADIANHLAFLVQTHNLSAASLKTRRAAINSILDTKSSKSTASDPLITGVLKGNSQPISPSFDPKWDLAIVPNFLKGPRFRDNKLLDDVSLTYKTAFLVALASGRRTSEITNKSCIKGHFIKAPNHSLTLKFLPEFLT